VRDGRTFGELACTVSTRWCWENRRELKTSLAPLFSLFGVLSSDKSTPGDLLDANLKQLQAQMTELKLAVSRSQGWGCQGWGSLRTIPML
jgi:hypothetical protein